MTNTQGLDPFQNLATAAEAAKPVEPKLTEKQEAFLNRLLAERPMFRDVENLWPDNIAKLTKKQASVKIDEVLAVAKETPARPAQAAASTLPRCPSGRYALVEDGVMKFYKVNSPTEGRWAGYTFVDAQASDDWWPIKNRAHREEILAAILADDDALARYGREIGKCGRCGRTLTSEWRLRGIGPVCNAKAW